VIQIPLEQLAAQALRFQVVEIVDCQESGTVRDLGVHEIDNTLHNLWKSMVLGKYRIEISIHEKPVRSGAESQ
jgi:hypothetical protein